MMIEVLIVEDSPVLQLLLEHIYISDPELHVMGIACDGEQALEFVKRKKPDVISMDVHMPKMNGFDATRAIMETNPVPIVMVSASWNPEDVETMFRALDAGAVSVVEKPPGIDHPDFESLAGNMVQTLKLMSEVKVVRRWGPRHRAKNTVPPVKAEMRLTGNRIKCVAIGASTGGPPVLQTILSGLPGDFPAAVLIVQHIAAGFLPGLVDWLGQFTKLPVHIATHGEPALPGHVFLAPDGFQMGVDAGYRIVLCKDAPENGLRPAISYLFRTVSNVFGSGAAGVLLTGMGTDGAEELKRLKEKGALTIAQDRDSSVVNGMPGRAVELGAATFVLPPDGIASTLASLAKR